METQDHIAQLEAQITALKRTQAALREEWVEAQLDQWQARIDDLEVQVHLAAMDTSERIAPLMDDLRNIWIDARNQLGGATDLATTAATNLQEGVESAYRDVRTAVLEAKKLIKS